MANGIVFRNQCLFACVRAIFFKELIRVIFYNFFSCFFIVICAFKKLLLGLMYEFHTPWDPVERSMTMDLLGMPC